MTKDGGNGQPAPLVKCECGDCACENATAKNDPEIEAVCYFCANGDHRTPRVKALEAQLTKALSQIVQLERMKGIEWKN